ncbi:MAG: M48 family metalloprotease [Nitrospirae bacterium]|nr:M48 family metalloprotease [Nitrospirota bacterium]
MKQSFYIRFRALGNAWIRRFHHRAFAAGAALALILAAACAGGGPPPGPAADAPAPDTAKLPPAPAGPELKGKEMGREFVAVALREYRFVTDYAVTEPVRRIGGDIVRAAGDDPERYHFFVVENPQANAFAIPGGYIFVFDGLLTRLHDEEELAGVLAHEVGHVKLEHFFKDQKKIAAADLAAIAAILLGQVNEAVTAFSLAGSASVQLAFSREHEREADQAALGYLDRAGIDPHGLVAFFDTLARQQRLVVPSGQYPYLSTHPGLDERHLRVGRFIERSDKGVPPRRDGTAWARLQGVLAVDALARRPAPGGDFPQGVALLAASRFGEALPYLERAAAERPASAPVRTALGTALLRLGRRDEARTVAGALAEAAPGDAAAQFLAGEVARDAGDGAAAEAAYRRAIQADAQHPMSHFRLSELLDAAGKGAEARLELARYLRLTLQPGQAATLLEELKGGPDPAVAAAAGEVLRALLADGV